MSKIGTYRILPAQTSVWSISNQSNIVLAYDCPIKIVQLCHRSTIIVAKPQYRMYEGGYIDRGTDEWMIKYEDTVDV